MLAIVVCKLQIILILILNNSFYNINTYPNSIYMFSCFAPKIVNIKKFKHSYHDNKLFFFRKMLIDARIVFYNILTVLEESIKEKKEKEWNECITAIKSIAEDLFFERLVRLNIERTPNLTDFNKIKKEVECLHKFKYNL